MEKKLTIVTAVRNVIVAGQSNAFKRCLESVKALPFLCEHIIVDGASDDDTLAIVREINPLAKIISEKDDGIYDALNKGLSAANGDYFYVLGADDFIEIPENIEGALSLARGTNLDMVISPVISDTENGRVLWPEKQSKLRRILFRMCYSHQGLMMKTSIARALGGFNLKYRISADCDLALRAMLANASIGVFWRPYANFGQQGTSSRHLFRRVEMTKVLGENLQCDINEAKRLEQEGTLSWKKIIKLLVHRSSFVRKAAWFMLLRRLRKKPCACIEPQKDSELIDLLSSHTNVSGLELYVDKSAIQGNLLFSGQYNGAECFVKYSPKERNSIKNEYEMGKIFNSIIPEHSPKMIKFVDINGLGAACVMEKCSGVVLSKYLLKSEFSEREVDDLSSQLSEMLKLFREHGVAHRDFGAYNIIRCDDGTIKAVDFQNSIATEGHDTLADICLSRKSLYFLYSNLGYGCGTFNDYSLLRRGLPPRLVVALDKKIGEGVDKFNFHCPLPAKVIFYCLWNLPACLIRSWFLSKNSAAKEKAYEKIAAIKRTINDTKERICVEGIMKGFRNMRRYVYKTEKKC